MTKNTGLFTLLTLGLFAISTFLTPCQAVGACSFSASSENGFSRQELRQLRQGDRLFELGGIKMTEALSFYMPLWQQYPENPILNYRIGVAFLEAIQPDSAIYFLERAKQLESKEPDLYLLLSNAYFIDHDFEKARQHLLLFRKNLPANALTKWRPEVEKRLKQISQAETNINKPANVIIRPLDHPINTNYDDYNALLFNNGTAMLFTSRRPATSRSRKDDRDNKYHERILVSWLRNGKWSDVEEAGSSFNRRSHSATAGISSDGRRILLYQGEEGGNIAISTQRNEKWSVPQLLRRVNSRHHESTATMSSDGRTLYFISERPGGYGGKDIWISHQDDRGRWSEPENLGPVVNTEYDEEGLFLAPDDKTLYFGSKGHNSMGGYDIFVTRFENGRWTVPENLGYPVNSASDDLFFTICSNTGKAYLSSNRPAKTRGINIYEVIFGKPSGSD